MRKSKKIYVKNVYWHNIYFHIVLDDFDSEDITFFVSDLKGKMFPLVLENKEIIINIVNIPEVKLLGNGKWYIVYQDNGSIDKVYIKKEVGYKLQDMDKIFKYGSRKYSYLVNFNVEEYESEYEQEMTFSMETAFMMLNKKETKRNIFIESNSLKQFVRKALFIIVKSCIQVIYRALYFLRHRDGKHILLMSETRCPISGNLKSLDKRIKERSLDKEYKITHSFFKTLQQSKFQTLKEWTRLLWILPKQDFVFVDDYVPIFKTITLQKETKLIQLWHAGVGFKSVGYSRFGKSGSPLPTDSCHRKYDYVVVGSTGLIDVYEEVFGVDKSNFCPYGLPRLDDYLNKEKIKTFKTGFYKKYPEFKDKKIILFAPTYRGTTQKEAYYPLEKINHKKLYDLCSNQYVFLYKMHPFIKQKIEIEKEYENKIFDFSSFGDINDLFYVTEILITDFSSNIYEFALHKKPIIFYAYDKDFYQLTRGVHRTLDEAPGVICESFDNVLETIKEEKFSIEKLDEFIEKSFVKDMSVSSSDKIIDNIILRKETR